MSKRLFVGCGNFPGGLAALIPALNAATGTAATVIKKVDNRDTFVYIEIEDDEVAKKFIAASDTIKTDKDRTVKIEEAKPQKREEAKTIKAGARTKPVERQARKTEAKPTAPKPEAKPTAPKPAAAASARRGTVALTMAAVVEFLMRRVPGIFARHSWTASETARFGELVKNETAAELAVLLSNRALRLCERRLAFLEGCSAPKTSATPLAEQAQGFGEHYRSAEKLTDPEKRAANAFQNVLAAYVLDESDQAAETPDDQKFWSDEQTTKLWSLLDGKPEAVELAELLIGKCYAAEQATYLGVAENHRNEKAMAAFIKEKMSPQAESNSRSFAFGLKDARLDVKKESGRKPTGLGTLADSKGARNAQSSPAATPSTPAKEDETRVEEPAATPTTETAAPESTSVH